MSLVMLLAIFPKPLSWQPLLFQIILFVQNKSQDLSLRQSFIKTKYLQNYRDLQCRVAPLFYKTYILLIFIKGFQTPLRKLSKGDVMSPLVFEKSTKALLLYLKLFSTISKS
jgi:hypothetical protein